MSQLILLIIGSSWLQETQEVLADSMAKTNWKSHCMQESEVYSNGTLKGSSTRGHILKILGKQIHDEIKVMSSDQTDSIM